ncbi:MAG: LysR family transcriptional regulator [Lysobacter sp.]|nr:LysR family transcriptional regulator [Lysobacter sp.]
MDLKHLRLIEAIAEHGGLTAAGRDLHLSQPALSQQLANLEAELGLALFHRIGRKMTPTAAARMVLESGSGLLAGMRDLEERVRRNARGLRCEVRLGIQCYTALHWLPQAMVQFHRTHPSVELKIVNDATHEPVLALLDGRIDVGVLNATSQDPRLRTVPMFKDELVVISAPGHAFGARPHVAPEDLVGEQVFVYSAPHGGGALNALVQPVRRKLARWTEMQWTDPIITFVAAGMGVGIVPDWVLDAPAARRKLQRSRLTAGGLRRTWSVATLDSRAVPESAIAFSAALRDATRALASRRR